MHFCNRAAAVGVVLLPLMLSTPAQSQQLDQGLSRQVVVQSLSNARNAKQRTRRDLNRTQSAARVKLGRRVEHIWMQHLDRRRIVDQRRTPPPGGLPIAAPPALKVGHPFLRLRQERLLQVYVNVADTTLDSLALLSAAGLDIELSNSGMNLVQGWIDLDDIEGLSTLAVVNKIEAPRYAFNRTGSVNTAGDSILRANRLRQMGIRGQGIRLGIISDGANNWTSARASGNLPQSITRYGSCSPRARDPRNCAGAVTCNEGTAMAEIIHDIAPDARLAVAAASTSLEFIQRVNQLANSFRADIIVDDLGFLAEPYFEDGALANAVANVSGRVLYVSAAGNGGNGHYERDYTRDSDSELHDFGRARGGGSDTDMGVVVPPRSGLLAILQWNDSYNAASSDYDLYLFNQSGIETGSAGDQINGDPSAIEGFCYYNASSSDVLRWITVDRFTDSNTNRRLEMIISNRGSHQYNDAPGSIFGHPAVKDAIAVGAINAADPGHDNIAFYSSRGPARIDFPSLDNRRKPDLVAIDGVRVSGAGGFQSTFFGTSAAAPHVAGIAALLLSSSPAAGPGSVRSALLESAIDLGVRGYDFTYGHGRVDALLALEMLKSGFTIAPIFLLLGD